MVWFIVSFLSRLIFYLYIIANLALCWSDFNSSNLNLGLSTHLFEQNRSDPKKVSIVLTFDIQIARWLFNLDRVAVQIQRHH